MKKVRNWCISFRTMLLVVMLVPGVALGSSGGESCDTRYPVILSHGMGATTEILGILDYWFGIEDALTDEGAEVYFTSVNGMDATADKAAAFKRQYLEILAVSGADKANVIGHSHGTIYTRYAISNLGLSGQVASHTSLAGPHKGSSVADVIMYDLPGWLVDAGSDALDFIYAWIFGDVDPDTQTNGYNLCTDYMTGVFNPNTPDVEGVYYQSWAAKIKTMAIDARNWYFLVTWPIILNYEGANDGLVSVDSAKWGNFRGVEDAAWWSAGCDHLNIIGQPLGLTPGFDAPEFFVDIVSDLKERGY